ncbi:hypothetical protein SAMN05660649_04548 [Desulfotomaculum arcticum]|uniref:SpoVT-AbrB domain-containing protein n=1 Tax=Desulfotruncus arcticus DSM 17038 TaxID=1121424 RepID=A0A1I2YQM5_9FIRM|nr:hypothetical protein [Desulfotruncus arcticus]SFH27619.1 hypothetical protein SAMN05660649_04548 [Desulfotomaculum arcticum] [Desulfotruncus arcticus DSM 17038]
MMNTKNIMLNERAAKETRLIKSTSKRQITIPKSFFGLLAIEDGVTFVAQVNESGIFLKPQSTKKQSIRDQDREHIIRQVFREGNSEEEIIEELNYRLKKYDEFIARRVQEFDNDIADSYDGTGDEPEVESFNGLDIFIHEEAGASLKES